MVIYELAERKEDWFVKADADWARGVLGTLLCRACVRVRRGLHPRPIDVKLRHIGARRSVAFVSQITIGVIHKRLLDRLGEYLTGFALGGVYNADGAKMDGFSTFYSGHAIIVRGSADSEVKQCPICGAIFYPRKGDPYVLSHQLGDEHVYQDEICCTYVDEWLAARVDWSKFRDIQLVPYPIRDHPEDGLRLPGDPDWSEIGLPCREPTLKVCKSPGIKNVDIEDVPADAGSLGERQDETLLPPPVPPEQPMQFKYFAGPIADMTGFAGETKPCSLCGQPGPCFELADAICPELPQEAREGRIGCYDCLRAGRFEFEHGTDKGMLAEDGLISEQTGEPYLPDGFSEAALVELRRTPRIATNQDETWLTHCHDFMAYQEVWSPSDFYKHAPDGDGRALFLAMTNPDQQNLWDDCWFDKSEPLGNWYGTYYVFKCLHCGELRGNWDID